MEGAGEEAIDATEIAGIRGKESNSSPKPNSSNRQEMLIPGNEWADRTPQVFLDGLKSNRFVASEPPSVSLCSGDMVEELTLTTNKKSNLLVVGTSNTSREGMPIRPGQWQHLYQLGGGSGNGNLGNLNSRLENVSKDKEPAMPYGGGDGVNTFLPEMWSGRHLPNKQSEFSRRLMNNDNKSESQTGIRTKNLPASGFSQFFVKNSLKGKGTVCGYPQRYDRTGVRGTKQNIEKATYADKLVFDQSPNSAVEADHPSVHSVALACPGSAQDGVSLREWLKPGRVMNKTESLNIFRQIVELADLAHAQQVALQDVRPSSFKLFSSNQIKYVGSFGDRESSGFVMNQDVSYATHHSSGKRFFAEGLHPYNLSSKQHKHRHDLSLSRQQCKSANIPDNKHHTASMADMSSSGTEDSRHETIQQHDLLSNSGPQNKSTVPIGSNTAQQHSVSINIQLEEKWYISPEELSGRLPTFSSDIYRLGVLLFELFCCFGSWEMHAAAMLDLRHRILSPAFLSEYPKEAGFCLWLLHPEPSSRPTTREILQSELISESRELPEDQFSSPIDEDDTESELLLHFLISLKEHKHKQASKLVEDIGCLEADIEEVEKRHLLRKTGVRSWKQDDSNKGELGFIPKEYSPVGPLSRVTAVSKTGQARLMKNMNQLESAYFSMRSQLELPDTDSTGRSDKDVLKSRERCFLIRNENEGKILNQNCSDRLGDFFDGLCKYACYCKFEVRGTLRNGDLLNTANVICSLSFDRDEEYFAAAGVSKKIKIFEFEGLLNDSVDIHYPVVEMTNKSKLSCVSWNNYIKNYLASTDYDGVVQLWDANTGQGFSQYTDHEKRAWSVDFSPVDPRKLASGSDDCSVKIWTINEKKCISTIQNTANVCCVQFSSDSTHLLAFGCADYKTYCYDLRNTRHPWCTLSGHGKAVSYVKFIDPETLISASTDNTLKLWDLNKTSSTGLSANACSLTFRGHTNEKNFVGLSISDGYIACGSETNEVYAYYKSLPMPITSHKFGSIDPISGQENGDDNGQFVSSVCWRGKSDMVVAANSSGSIKVLQMV